MQLFFVALVYLATAVTEMERSGIEVTWLVAYDIEAQRNRGQASRCVANAKGSSFELPLKGRNCIIMKKSFNNLSMM
ncbi:MAG: hypothetical protein KBS83_00495 [Lachnospiraceae bacterium]|nr:hypothetical protein [Candidatus Equihabitans merdae]